MHNNEVKSARSRMAGGNIYLSGECGIGFHLIALVVLKLVAQFLVNLLKHPAKFRLLAFCSPWRYSNFLLPKIHRSCLLAPTPGSGPQPISRPLPAKDLSPPLVPAEATSKSAPLSRPSSWPLRHRFHCPSRDNFYLRFLPSLTYNLSHAAKQHCFTVFLAPCRVGLMRSTSTFSFS